MARERISQVEVLTWLKANHPSLHEQAEVDRQWVWITGDSLRPTHKKVNGKHCECEQCLPVKQVREAVNEYGFVFSRHGHDCPSGKKAWWGHSCQKPMPFKRKGDGKSHGSADNNNELSEQEALAVLGF